MEITPSSNSAKFTVTKHRPLFGYKMFPELEYGFCLHKENTPLFADDYINVRNPNDDARQKLNHFDLTTTIPYSRLEKNTTYILYPYSRVDHLGAPYYIYRQGKRFEYDMTGNLSFKNLSDVPGEDL